MIMQSARELIVEFGQKMAAAALTTGSGGNLSIIDRAQGFVAIKPSGIEYAALTPADIVVMNTSGERIDGERNPSSEVSLHLCLYEQRSDIGAVVHTHSVYATTIACLNWELPAVHYLVGFSGDKVPLAAYAAFGTQDLADNVIRAIGDYNACLLANHGLVSVGPNIARAFRIAEQIELVARLYVQAKSIGDPVILSAEEMAVVVEKFKNYGQ